MSVYWKLVFLSFVILISSCKTEKKATKLSVIDSDSYWTHEFTTHLNKAIVNDIFSPPVASRIYAYTYLSGYIPFYNKEKDLFIQKMNTKLQFNPPENYDPYLTSIFAMQLVANDLVFSTNFIDDFENNFKKYISEKGISEKQITDSRAYAKAIFSEIKSKLISQDMYAETRTMVEYKLISNDISKWIPTPPDYLDALEPHWSKIKPIYLKSPAQFAPELDFTFSIDKKSKFFSDLIELYNYTKDSIDSEKNEIAEFWDCNPFVTEHVGHFMKGVKKITPGGHWIGINRIVSKQKETNIPTTLRNYAVLSMGMMDAFISCWDEKYRSNLVRPETLINIYLDPEWKPQLYTPSFPEHPSGHSVVSGTASTILTKLYGDNIAYSDDTEVEFGLPVRTFESFTQAAEEAAVSRYYGGIHYKPAVYDGLAQGRDLATFIISEINL